MHGAGHGKLDAVLGQLHHSSDDHGWQRHSDPCPLACARLTGTFSLPGNHQKLNGAGAFLLDFPMRTNYMHARVTRSLVKELFALTVCFWVKPGPGPGLGTPFSYAVPGQANELVLIEWGGNPMELLISDEVKGCGKQSLPASGPMVRLQHPFRT